VGPLCGLRLRQNISLTLNNKNNNNNNNNNGPAGVIRPQFEVKPYDHQPSSPSTFGPKSKVRGKMNKQHEDDKNKESQLLQILMDSTVSY